VKDSPATWVVPLGCALAGGLAGHFAFLWIARQGFYAIILPGALIGFAGGWFVQRQTMGFGLVFGIVCALLALIAGIISEWRLRPFVADNSFGYFITHLQQLRPITLIMIAIGAVFAFWFAATGRRRAPVGEPVSSAATPEPTTKE
jgi:hypothetical protein